MGQVLRYITVEEDRRNKKLAQEHGIYYSTPRCLLLRDAPEEFDAFEYNYKYDGNIETILN